MILAGVWLYYFPTLLVSSALSGSKKVWLKVSMKFCDKNVLQLAKFCCLFPRYINSLQRVCCHQITEIKC